ncbi:TPA: ATP-dependent helicase [Serratia marcescens]|uniref:UvrD-helicase domain-containing protein n=1 Tax=Serratia TaxID=613 RepID=UPI0011C753D3|nr:ATP-dependent helicase [Serratia nevei]MBH3314206.1 ATP-dependent helicase [Serratia marcescens]TXE74553.1 ATP-dependent helicase [Serratia nevei]HEJ9136403.1 ATP-dependent helicase [Serratia marcescens]
MDLKYTAEQDAAINYNESMVVTACPGSGKTTVIVEKIRRIIPTLRDYQGVIAITFTVKASDELKSRCKKNAFNTKQTFFGTIDSFCFKEIIHPFISRVWGKSDKDIQTVYNDDLEEEDKDAYADITSSVLTTEAFTADIIDRLKALYKKGWLLMSSVGVIANHIIENSESCRKYLSVKYKGVFVDEYQDSSEPQHKLFLKLVDLGMIGTAVGDEDQSIYEFRGGNPEFVEDLKKVGSGFASFNMTVNHRCHPSISNYARRLFDDKCALIQTDEIMVRRYNIKGNQTDVAKQISKWIPNAKEKFDIKNNIDIAILVRNNTSLGYVSQGLQVPHRVYEDNPLASYSDVFSKLFTGLLHYRYNEKITSQEIISDYIKSYFSERKCRDFRRVIKQVRRARASDEDLINSMQSVSCSVYGVPAPQKIVQALKTILSTPSIKKQFEIKDENEIQVMTLHKAKGLEFDLVFHLDLYEWVFPWRKPTDNFDDPPLYPSWKQELDLHYVGITRAKKLCVLMTSTSRIKDGGLKKGQPSRFFELPGLKGLYLAK